MNKIHRSLAVLVLALAGLMGCDSEPRTVHDVNSTHVAEAKEALRDLWVGHIFWTHYVMLNNATHNPEARDAAEEEVVANARQIASTMTPFYGEATAAENNHRQNAALTRLASIADDIAVFLNRINPYLSRDHVRGLIAAHGAHHVMQINQCKDIADTMTTALVKQFPGKFS